MSDALEQRVVAEIGEWVNYGSDEAIAESARSVIALCREDIAAEIEADAVTLCAACRAADGTENRRCNDCANHRHWFARAARLVRRGEQQ